MKKNPSNTTSILLSMALLLLPNVGCKKQEALEQACTTEGTLLSKFENPEGLHFRIYSNGEAYSVENRNCEFVDQYFEPNFLEEKYKTTNTGTAIIVDENTLFDTHQEFLEDFENKNDITELFLLEINQRNKLFTNMNLLSPSAPTVEDYIALQKCLLNKTCDFLDNRFDLVADPINANNTVVKFSAIAPTADMVTAKSSITSTLLFWEQGDDFWFEAKYFIGGDMPTTLADFESSHFFGSPGPRIIIKGDEVAIENKFGTKELYRQNVGPTKPLPKSQWVTLKVHLQYDEENGVIQLWQDGELIIDHIGRNMPLPIWIQDRLEVGITATSKETQVYVDDVRFSNKAF